MWKYVLATVAVLFSALNARAGEIVHMQNSDPKSTKDKPTDHQILYAQEGLLRLDELDDQGHVARVQLVRDGGLWLIDMRRRTYSHLDKAAVSAEMGTMNNRMQAALQNMPPERRAMFEQQMKNFQQKSQDWTVKDTGRVERAGKYSCEVWQVQHNGSAIMEDCVAPTSSLPGGADLVSTMHKAAATAEDVLSAAPQLTQSATKAMFAVWGKVDGFPVLKRDVAGSTPTGEIYVSDIEQRALPADKFALPAGFTEQPLGGAGAD